MFKRSSMTQSWIEFCSATIQKGSVVQLGLDVDRESVTSPEQQVMVPCETAMDEDEMMSSTQRLQFKCEFMLQAKPVLGEGGQDGGGKEGEREKKFIHVFSWIFKK